jgi:uncharacterized hydrophobic protein (TIGR00271 family)
MPSTALPTAITKLGFDPDYLPAFEDKLFIEGRQTARRLTNFFALLLFATVIATYGVLSGSTATVIGAMIVAPLMGPIIATTAAVVMGSLPRALRAFALTVAGIAAVVIFSYLLAWVVPDVTISFTSNGEITSRINPGLYALLTALGAGAAGAFIVSRAEIADSMGGVAIAISLVPPLCVVGISLQKGRWDAAGGALLLFMTNYLAILLAGGLTLVVLGVGKVAGAQEQARVRRRGFILFTVGILLVSIPLTLTAYQSVIHAMDSHKATAEVNQWLEGTSYQVDMVKVNDRVVIATIEGTGELKPVQQLANQLAVSLRHPVIVNLRTLPALEGIASSP